MVVNQTASRLVVVRVEHDPEVNVWYVSESSLAGLSAEADTFEALVDRIPGLVVDLVESNGFDDADDEHGDVEFPVEIIASTRHRVRVRAAVA